jgi:hypothetical protein
MKKRRAKASSRRKATKPPNDTALIRECVIYAQSVAAHRGGFPADTGGDMTHAAALGARHLARAQQALTRITNMTASTSVGLQSKACILPMVIEDSCGGMEALDELFFRSFAANVKAFLEPLVRELWRAKAAAKAEVA